MQKIFEVLFVYVILLVMDAVVFLGHGYAVTYIPLYYLLIPKYDKWSDGCLGLLSQVVAASGAVKHEDIVQHVKSLFTKLSTDPTTASQLVAKEPTIFTGSEARLLGSIC